MDSLGEYITKTTLVITVLLTLLSAAPPQWIRLLSSGSEVFKYACKKHRKLIPLLNYNKKQVCINSGEIKIVSNGTRVICTRWQKGFVTCHLLFRYTYKKILKKYHFRFIHMNYFQRAVLISLFISWSWFEQIMNLTFAVHHHHHHHHHLLAFVLEQILKDTASC